MKRFSKMIAFSAMALVMGTSMVACGTPEGGEQPPKHVCEWQTEWTYDDANHWYKCKDSQCELTNGLAAHTYVDGVCVCGAEQKPGTPVHECTFATEWSYDDDNHWHACTDETCDEVSGLAAHTYVDGACSVCDATEKAPERPGHVCTFKSEWSMNSTHHWHECVNATCDEIKDFGAHTSTGICVTCKLGLRPYASKLAEGQTITIDGTIDDAWTGGFTFRMQYELDGKAMSVDPAEAKVMWDANGLYFMAKVYDNTIVDADRVDFWVSETYRSRGDHGFSKDASAGEYVLGLRNDLVFRNVADGYDATEDCNFAVAKYQGYYVVEAYMPKMSEGEYQDGHVIGLEICTNHYDEGTSRLFCVPWNVQGSYWETPTALNQVTLLDLN